MDGSSSEASRELVLDPPEPPHANGTAAAAMKDAIGASRNDDRTEPHSMPRQRPVPRAG
jgi:hypothetical protein